MSTEQSFTEEEYRAAQDKIGAHVSAAYAELSAAKKLADKYKLSFSFSPAYGMGGRYYGNVEDRYNDESEGWQASSHDC